MSKIMTGILRMPEELYWDESPLRRAQHNANRFAAADEIERLQAELAAHKLAPMYLHPQPAPDVQGEPVAIRKLGITGAAFDPLSVRRAYTYSAQPNNTTAWKLGRAACKERSGGDFIDYGLQMLRYLQDEGFGVFEIDEAATAQQPECGCCGQTVKCDPDCDAVILRKSDQQPAPQTEMLDDDSLARQIGEIGNQIHNLGCEHQNDEGLADRLAEIAHQAWMLQRSVMVSKQQPAQDVAGLVEALEVARQFIVNGIEAGAVRMPDSDTPDPAHNTLPMIDAALAAHRKAQRG